jgi:hypothetical protein
MAFWSDNSVEPLRKRSFKVIIGEDESFSFLAKSVNKPTVETDVNEYRLINQIVKFPTVPRWNDITIKYIDTETENVSGRLEEGFYSGEFPNSWQENIGCPSAIEKGNDSASLTIDQYNANGEITSSWRLVGPFVKSINFGDNDYSSDDFVEVEVVIAYDYAVLE